MNAGSQAAQDHIDGLEQPRRSQVQHLHDVILANADSRKEEPARAE